MCYPNKFKQGFIDRVEKKLRDCEIIYNPNTKGIWFINREERYWYLEYKIETNYLWWRYEFFNQLKELFCMPNEVFYEIISEWVENKLNGKVVTTAYQKWKHTFEVEDTLNCKVDTTFLKNGGEMEVVEETLNCKVVSTLRDSQSNEKRVEETLNINVTKLRGAECEDTEAVEEALNCKVDSTWSLLDDCEDEVDETLNLKVNRVDWGLSQHLNIEDTLNINNNIK